MMSSEPLTIAAALAYGARQLHASESPALDARLLLEHVLQVNHAYLIAHTDQLLDQEDEATFRKLVRRAALREPVPYLVGEAFFYGRRFVVSPDVLIPRPETELLVEQALSRLQAWSLGRSSTEERLRVVDVGTGSGCIAVTLALEATGVTIEAVEPSPAALAVAKLNAAQHDLTQPVVFHLGSLLEPIAARVDLIVANLPYVADHEWTTLDDGIKWYEPAAALRGGPDGLALIRNLLEQAAEKLAPGGAILLEIGWQQGTAALEMARGIFPTARLKIVTDYGGRDRLLAIDTVECC